MRTRNALIVLLVLVVPGISSAHHSATIFDRNLVVAFQGIVTQFTWANPHVYIHVATQDSTGNVVEWEIETDATPILTRSGWTRDTFVPGEQVSVRLNPDRNVERDHGLLISISKSDGSTYSARSYFLRDPDDTEALARASLHVRRVPTQDDLARLRELVGQAPASTLACEGPAAAAQVILDALAS